MDLKSYLSEDVAETLPEEYVKMRVDEGLKTLGAVNMTFNVRGVGLGVKMELYHCNLWSENLG